MLFDAALLDADRTLFDFDRSEEIALPRAFAQCNLPYQDRLLHHYRQINHDLWTLFEQGGIVKERLLLERFERLFEVAGLSADTAAFNDAYQNYLSEGTQLIEGAEEVCRALHTRCRLIIATNGEAQVQYKRIERSAIRPYISDVFVSETIGFQKPMKEFFDVIFRQIGVQSLDRVIIVGDSLSSDIAGGINAGIATCWFNPSRHPNPTALVPDFEIQTLSQLHDIVR